MNPATRKIQFILFALLAACASGLPGNGPDRGVPFAESWKSSSALPRELLYVAGGPRSARDPSIEVFNGEDTSPSPQPMYTIAPRGGGSYGAFAVDAINDLFAVNYFTNGAKLLVFASGKTTPTVSCLLDNMPQGMYIEGNALYLSTASYTIEEYKLPIGAGHKCPKPIAVLTDQHAKLRGSDGLFAPAVDPSGDIFDIWFKSTAGEKIDEFPDGSIKARNFAPLKQTFADSYMISDSSGDLITSVSGTVRAIAMFPHGSRVPQLFDPIQNGTYLGFAVAAAGTELFAALDYPTTEVEVFEYNSSTGKVGRVLRSFSDVWYYAQSIAVFSRK